MKRERDASYNNSLKPHMNHHQKSEQKIFFSENLTNGSNVNKMCFSNSCTKTSFLCKPVFLYIPVFVPKTWYANRFLCPRHSMQTGFCAQDMVCKPVFCAQDMVCKPVFLYIPVFVPKTWYANQFFVPRTWYANRFFYTYRFLCPGHGLNFIISSGLFEWREDDADSPLR